MSKHTQGDWWRDDEGFIAAGHGDTYVTIADPHCSDLDIDEREANTALITAAPDLLEACQHLVKHLSELPNDTEKCRILKLALNNRAGDMIHAAIAKALDQS